MVRLFHKFVAFVVDFGFEVVMTGGSDGRWVVEK